ncbi:MAG: T9SS type A sorting domain-containing protein [Cyclobacteriaceae bacterium]
MYYDLTLVNGTLTILAALGLIENPVLRSYPNPVSSAFTLSNTYPDFRELTVHNLSGGLVKRFNEQAERYSIAELKPGIYTLSLMSGNERYLLKVIKK